MRGRCCGSEASTVRLFPLSLAWIFVFACSGNEPAVVAPEKKPATEAKVPVKTAPPKKAPEAPSQETRYRPVSRIPHHLQQRIDTAVYKAQHGKKARIPGAVVLIGRGEEVLFFREYGQRAVVPAREAMTLDTIFDVASMTKAVVTSTAIMQLVERGKVSLTAAVQSYLPEFKGAGKEDVTIEDLLRHRSGLPAANPLTDFDPTDRAASIRKVLETPLKEKGPKYSDLGFIVLGEVVATVSKMPLDAYAQKHIFAPLNMRDSSFRPSPDWNERIAPTEVGSRRQAHAIRGEVHDPRAFRLGGVSGNAGLFTTASDLAIFSQALLRPSSDSPILSPASIAMLYSGDSNRGLGWQRSRPEFSTKSMGHGGYTGTFFWVDVQKDLFVVILTNRVHPTGVAPMGELRLAINEAAIKSLPVLLNLEGRLPAAFGIDVLEANGFKQLRGKRVGLITNQSGRSRDGRRTLDILVSEPSVEVVRVFGPEHGIDGDQEGAVSDGKDSRTNVPIVSLFGKGKRRPKQALLADLDVLVFDIQDVGARFYTYVSTMREAMSAAASESLPFIVLDRPNPLGDLVEGTLVEDRFRSFVNHFALPVRHGMTVGELAKMFVSEDSSLRSLPLSVVRMDAPATSTWDELQLGWIPPSPNLKNTTQVTLYPGTAMVESANVSVGRGTNTPFELVGAPYISSKKMLASLQKMSVPGVQFEEAQFRPNAARFRGQTCQGVRISITDAHAFRAFPLGLALARALAAFPEFDIAKVSRMVADQQIMAEITQEASPAHQARIQKAERDFVARRKPFLLYSRKR